MTPVAPEPDFATRIWRWLDTVRDAHASLNPTEVATLPKVTGSAEELLRAADMAIYKVKAVGKDGIHVTEER